MYVVCALVSQYHALQRVWVLYIVGIEEMRVFLSKLMAEEEGTEGPVCSYFEIRGPLACHSCFILRSFCCMHLILTSETARDESLGGLQVYGH